MAPRERAHAKIGPSALARTIRCPGSINFIESMEEEDSAGVFAAEGTILHSFAEDCLNKGLNPFDLVGEERTYDGYTYELTEDDAQGILDGLDAIDDIPGKLLVEARVDLSRWMPGQFGTCDIAVIDKKPRGKSQTVKVTIADWKFGFVAVSPVENEQLMAYALGVWDNFAEAMIPYDLHGNVNFKLMIFQPRAPGGGGEWEVWLDDLLAYGKKLKRLAKEVADPDAPRIAGEKQCQYCPGAKLGTCPEYNAFNLEMIVRDFAELDDEIEDDLPLRLTPPSVMTPERRSHIVKHNAMITKWLERLHAETLDAALKGFATPGLKAVEGRNPARKWKNKAEAEETLIMMVKQQRLLYTERLITPTQAEKVLGEDGYKEITDLIDFGEPKAVLVSDQDARPALRNIVDEFNDGDDDDD